MEKLSFGEKKNVLSKFEQFVLVSIEIAYIAF